MDLTEQANMPYNHLERLSVCSVFCSRGCAATYTGFRHQGSSHNQSAASFRLIFGRSSPRPASPQVLEWHPHVPNNHTISFKPASNRTSTSLWHGDLAYRYFSANPAWRRGLLTGLRHGNPAYKYLRGIPAWRRGQLSALRPLFVTATLPTGISGASSRGKSVIYHPFATATLPTDTSVPSPRAEQSNNLSQTGL